MQLLAAERLLVGRAGVWGKPSYQAGHGIVAQRLDE